MSTATDALQNKQEHAPGPRRGASSTELSAIIGRRLRARSGGTVGRIHDLVARLGDERRPGIAAIVIARHRRRWRLEAGSDLDRASNLGDLRLTRTELSPARRGAGEIFLARDLLDQQVVDVRSARVVRVNDVLLQIEDSAWTVQGIDAGLPALLARLLPSFLRRRPEKRSVIPWSDLELLATNIPNEQLQVGHTGLARLHPADIARIADALPPRQATEIVVSLDDGLAADVVEEMVGERQADVVLRLESSRAAQILSSMAPDAAADVLARLEHERVESLLKPMPQAISDNLHALLTYPADTAGGMMTTDYVYVPRGLTVGEAVSFLRPQMETPDWVYYVYVVEGELDRRLLGVLTLRDLFIAAAGRTIDDLFKAAPRHAFTNTPAREVARMMSAYNLVALPVTSNGGHLLGIVSVDDAFAATLPAGLRRQLPRVFS